MENLSFKKEKFRQIPLHLPNFLIVGAARCGTTSLFYYLQQHPDVFMSPVKEPKFLSNFAASAARGPGDYLIKRSAVSSFDDYLRLFKKSTGEKALGEASVDTLFFYNSTIPKIQHYLGDPRIIIILRDPVNRAYSAYNYMVQYGREKLSFKDALIAEEQRKRDGYRFIWQYRETGLYASQVRAFQESFSRVQVLLYDDLQQNGNELLRSVYTFLDVNPDFIPDMSFKHNASDIPRWSFLNNFFVTQLRKAASKISRTILGANQWVFMRDSLRPTILKKRQPMDYDIEHELRRFYSDDIKKLQGYIGRDLSSWLEGEHL